MWDKGWPPLAGCLHMRIDCSTCALLSALCWPNVTTTQTSRSTECHCTGCIQRRAACTKHCASTTQLASTRSEAVPPTTMRSPHGDFVSELNARYARGQPSSDLAEAGLLVHMLDLLDGCGGRIDGWCKPSADRMSASLILQSQGSLHCWC